MKANKTVENNTAGKIMEAARVEFAAHGLSGARVDQIARRAKVNKAMIYYHFRSKEKLYQEVIYEHLAYLGKEVYEAILEEADLETTLLRIADFYHRMFEQRQNFMPIFLREIAAGGDRLAASFGKLMKERGLNKKLKKLIDDGKRAGLFRQVDSSHAIVSFVGMNLFYFIAAPVFNSVWEIKDEKKFRERRQKEVVDLFLNGLKVR